MSGERLARLGRLFCLAGAALGAIGLIGWITHTPFLTQFLAREPRMMPNTSVALLFLGVGGALRYRETRAPMLSSLLFAIVALVIGVVTLAQYVLGTNLGIDQLIVHGGGGPLPRRMSPLTTLAFTLLASALLLFDVRPTARVRPSEWLALSAGLTAMVGLTGMLLGAPPLYRLARTPIIGLSLPTGVSLLLISFGLLLERPNAGLMRVIGAPGPGGVLLRSLLLPTVLVPVLMGLVVTRILVGIEGIPLAVATLVIATAMIGVVLLGVIARVLNQKHEALERTRAQADDLVEHASDGIFVADLHGRYIDVNSAGCRMLGYSRSEIVGKAIVDFIPARDVERLALVKERLLEGDFDVDEWMLLRKDGTYLPVEVSAKILGDGRWQGFVRDISERKMLETEQQRIQHEERFLANVVSVLAETLDYEETVENLAKLFAADFGDACIVETLEEGGRVRRRAVAYKDESKATLAHDLQNAPIDLRRPHLGSSVYESKEPLLVSNVTPEYIASVVQGDDHERLLHELAARSLMALPLLAHGRLFGSIVLIRSTDRRPYTNEDLSFAERVVLRAALAIENARLYDAAQHAVRARDEVLEVVAHDLRNPLSAILLHASRLARGSAEPEHRWRAPVEGITRAATRMNRLIEDLLDVVRLEAGVLSIDANRVSAGRAVSDAMEAHEPLAASASLELRLDVRQDLPDVWADRDRLLQIFENLIGNAVKFTPPGGRITVGASERSGDVLFWVADTGTGMGDDDLASVFDRFWQARRGERHGAGLGLAIAKGLVEAHGGRMWGESTLGRGTTFFFTIPGARRIEGREGEQAPHHS